MKADYSQLEVRIYAHYTQEPVLVSAYLPGQERDVHSGVAAELGIPRPRAKNTLFGAMYGADGPKLAETAGVLPGEAAGFLARLRDGVPSLLEWPRRVEREIVANGGYIETLLGWREYYPDILSPIRSVSRAAVREAANLPIQGTAAGLMKRFMILADCHRLEGRYGARLVLQVHDEVVFEVPDYRGTVEVMARELQELGAEAGRSVLTVPLKLEIEVGPNWGQTQPLEAWLQR